MWWGKLERKSPLGKPRLRCKDNNKMNLITVEKEGSERIHTDHNRKTAGFCNRGNEMSGSVKYAEFF